MQRRMNPDDFQPRVTTPKRTMLFCLAAGLLLGRFGTLADTHTWTGASNGLWSNPQNWSGGAPKAGEAAPVKIIIPASAPGHRDLTNDVPGLVVQELTLAAHANTLHASPGVVLRLQDATLAGLGNSTILDDSCRLELSGVNHLQGSNDFILRGLITEVSPGAALKVSGNVRLETPSRHSGPTHLSGGSIFLLGSMTNTAFIEVATNAEVTLAADFTVLTNRGRLNIAPEAIERPETSRLFGQGFVCLPGSTNSVMMIDYPTLDSDDPADGGWLHSCLAVSGPVILAGRLEASTDLAQDGLRFVVVKNTGSAPTQGQFDRMPEGALMVLQNATLLTGRVSYHGGHGNDVTLTFVAAPRERRLVGPSLLGNGWLQVLGGIAEFEDFQPHRWEVNADISDPNGWSALGPNFIPGTDGTLLTLTNAAEFAQRFFRLKRL